VKPFFKEGPIEWDLMDGDCQLQALRFRFSPPTRFGRVYRKELVDSTNVSVFISSNATEMRLTDNKSAVRQLNVVHRGGGYRIKAKQYVLALGGLENPRFLLNSNQDLAAGLGNHSDLVGRYFISHAPRGGLGAVTLAGPHTKRILDTIIKTRTYIGIKEDTQRRLGLLNHGFALYRTADEDLPEDLRRYAEINREFSRFFDDDDDDDSVTCRLVSVAEQSPNRESRVSLDTGKDHTGMRKIRLDFRTDPIDRQSIAKSFEVLALEFGRLGLGRVRIGFEEADSLPFRPDDHHMGTTRMHVDPKQGVVDEYCRVHGLRNLFVAGGSVFPSGGFANPTMSMVAVSLRLADHLKGLL